MAIFSNQATLTVGGTSINSNVAFGEILDVLTVTKTAVEGTYGPDGRVTYVVTLRNTGSTALSGLTLSDDLGGGTNAPLAYVDNSVAQFADGAPVAAPAVTAGPPLTFTGINVAAGGDTVLVYQADTTAFADPSQTGSITNTVTATGAGLSAPVTAEATVNAAVGTDPEIIKSISPAQVVDNDRVTYTFVIRNFGNASVTATDNATITDTFDPVLTALSVTFEGAVWTEGNQYTYDPATGAFATTAGQIILPAATVTQNADGSYTVTPSSATLTVTGTI